MSCICGVLRFDGIPVTDSNLQRQINSLKSRGPDRCRSWRDGPIGLGHALMRVTEEDAFDDQPLVDRTAGITLVADLRLDNREQLAVELGIDERKLPALADSAMLMAAYKKWGEDCAEHLLGDFAFAIWDGRARKLVLGRDHMGMRWAFYYRASDFFVFGTTMRALWAVPDVPRRLDEFQIGKRLVVDRRQRRGATIFEMIFGLPAGTVMTISAEGAVRSRRYWEPHADPVHLGRDEAYYIETYRRLLTEAVQCRVRRAIRPAGLFMSGGFDSAAIAALAGPAVSAKGQKLIAAASVLPEDYRGPLEDARPRVEICRRAMPYLDVRYTTEGSFGLIDRLEANFLLTDTAYSPNRIVNTAILDALKEGGACVVMDGHGGDYTVNPTANGWLADQLLHGRIWTFLRELRAYKRRRNNSLVSLLKNEVVRPLLPQQLRRWLDNTRQGVPRDPFLMPITREFARAIRAKGGKPYGSPKPTTKGRWWRPMRILVAMQDAAFSHGYLIAAHGLEFAQPFHDKRIVEFALAIPPALFVRDGRDRYLARKALADLYPPEFETRQKGGDHRFPDFMVVAERERPKLLAEIARLERSERLARMFDFGRMRRMVVPVGGRFAPSSESRMRRAVRALIMARFVEWVERDNEFEAEPKRTPRREDFRRDIDTVRSL